MLILPSRQRTEQRWNSSNTHLDKMGNRREGIMHPYEPLYGIYTIVYKLPCAGHTIQRNSHCERPREKWSWDNERRHLDHHLARRSMEEGGEMIVLCCMVFEHLYSAAHSIKPYVWNDYDDDYDDINACYLPFVCLCVCRCMIFPLLYKSLTMLLLIQLLSNHAQCACHCLPARTSDCVFATWLATVRFTSPNLSPHLYPIMSWAKFEGCFTPPSYTQRTPCPYMGEYVCWSSSQRAGPTHLRYADVVK